MNLADLYTTTRSGGIPPKTRETADTPCPECIERGYFSNCGNRRAECGTCNRFYQRVRRKRLTLLPHILTPEQLKALKKAAYLNAYVEAFPESEWAAKKLKEMEGE